MKYGYIRVSTKGQNTDSQRDELLTYGVDEIVEEVVTGISKKKDVLDELIKKTDPGDEIVVLRHDRLGRNTLQLLSLIDTLKNKGVSINILNIGLDSSSMFYEPILAILSAFSDLDRQQLKEKQRLGIEAAKRRGKHLGRKAPYSKDAMDEAIRRFENREITYAQIREIYGIPKSSVFSERKKRRNTSLLSE